MPRQLYIALLRGINVSGKNLIRMADLRDLCSSLKLGDVQTYIQSGNIVFSASATSTVLESQIEAGISNRFSLNVPVMVRNANVWMHILESCPLQTAASSEPSRLYVLASKLPVANGAVELLTGKARDGEVIRLAGGCLWIHYPNGSGRSKLTPALIDRAAGSPATARNWKTATALAKMLA